MKIALCVEKSGGMLFNNRRVSQDSVVREKLLELAGEGGLYLNAYSAKQFENAEQLHISEDFFSTATEETLCFVENTPIDMEKVSQVCLFKWNRDYPADTFFDHDLNALSFRKIKTQEFPGTSHKKITLEIYRRRGEK